MTHTHTHARTRKTRVRNVQFNLHLFRRDTLEFINRREPRGTTVAATSTHSTTTTRMSPATAQTRISHRSIQAGNQLIPSVVLLPLHQLQRSSAPPSILWHDDNILASVVDTSSRRRPMNRLQQLRNESLRFPTQSMMGLPLPGRDDIVEHLPGNMEPTLRRIAANGASLEQATTAADERRIGNSHFEDYGSHWSAFPPDANALSDEEISSTFKPMIDNVTDGGAESEFNHDEVLFIVYQLRELVNNNYYNRFIWVRTSVCVVLCTP